MRSKKIEQKPEHQKLPPKSPKILQKHQIWSNIGKKMSKSTKNISNAKKIKSNANKIKSNRPNLTKIGQKKVKNKPKLLKLLEKLSIAN